MYNDLNAYNEGKERLNDMIRYADNERRALKVIRPVKNPVRRIFLLLGL